MTNRDKLDQTTRGPSAREPSSRDQYLDLVRQELDQFEQQELALRTSERRERLVRLLGEANGDPLAS